MKDEKMERVSLESFWRELLERASEESFWRELLERISGESFWREFLSRSRIFSTGFHHHKFMANLPSRALSLLMVYTYISGTCMHLRASSTQHACTKELLLGRRRKSKPVCCNLSRSEQLPFAYAVDRLPKSYSKLVYCKLKFVEN